jgi:hypothetical protein
VADIFREVDDDLKRDRLLALWKRYGNYIIGVAVLIVLATAATVFWRDYQKSQREAEGERFMVARDLAEGERTSEAIAAFAALARDAGAGYATLSGLEEAALRAQSGDDAGALVIYERMAGDSSLDAPYRDLAALLLALHSFDSADPQTLATRLAPLRAADNPWRYTAGELSALLAASGGDEAEAREILTALTSDPNAPPGLRARAAEHLAVLGE